MVGQDAHSSKEEHCPLGPLHTLPETRLDAASAKSASEHSENVRRLGLPSLESHDTLPLKSFETSTRLSERSVVEHNSRLIATSTRCKVNNTDDENFNAVLQAAVDAINAGVQPQLIPSGSSGSYFVLDRTGTPIGVFKPKDEEPFAQLNPKWPKFFQRMLCFCCFGRACLIPNNGYLSETAASLVDERLRLHVVPKTRVVKLASPAFHYGRLERRPRHPKAKEGSFQLFVHEFRAAGEVLAEWAAGQGQPEGEELTRFLLLFQKMCVLDFVIRNTDRHTDNWLIRQKPGEPIEVAVIDNGLAFPVKHPECASRFRPFPFKWAELPFATHPLDPELRRELLKLVTPAFVSTLCTELKTFFRHDTTNNRLLVYSQLRVLRGQLWSLRDALEADEAPADWVKRAPFIATRRYKTLPDTDDFEECFRRRPIDYSQRVCC